MINLKPGERLDDLERNGYKIIQEPSKFCFGMDAVLLSGFVKIKPGEKVLDMCTGSGIIPILLAAKTQAEHLTGIEIQPEVADMAERSVQYNNLEERINIVCEDINRADQIFGKSCFDVITCNPPYMKDAHGLQNPTEQKAIARHEIKCTLFDVVNQAVKVLKPNGRLYLVHRPTRLIEIINTLSEFKLETKRLQMVHPFIDKAANMVLIEAIRGAGSMVKVEKPIVVYKEQGVYTQEIYDIYGY